MKTKIDIYITTKPSCCEDAPKGELACSNDTCDLTLYDTAQAENAKKAKSLGIASFPAFVINDQTLDCSCVTDALESALENCKCC